ncbi:NLR, CARD domain-containing protein 3 [Phytophthora boehmeriae]|uniref:NLR, CARD domain-containing protein 3 n=1 Tax=Phytophthora boehmeriae TaxID=109152 RepID=A0A8T1X708_9STRA|nr:NLR, CARD domain-containing protein 3 [Phytophthora boehmeriae]
MARTKTAQVSAGVDNPALTEAEPPIENLEQKMESDGVANAICESVEVVKTAGPLDCKSSSLVSIADSNQETENSDAGVFEESSEFEGNQALDEQVGASSGSKCSRQQLDLSTLKEEDPETQSQQVASSTSTSSSGFVSSADSSTTCVGKPPRDSRYNRGSYPPSQMNRPNQFSRIEGPTLGSIMQRVHMNDGDVQELDFSSLALRNKRLEADGCALVARSLSTNHTVRKLTIHDHAIGDDGAAALSKMLCNNSTLESLDLHGNEISDRGVDALAQALYGHDSLKHLSLQGNLITDRGAEALAQAVRCNCTLKSLELVDNRITRVGAQALLDALDVNLHLETVNLEANAVPESIVSQLGAALARNRAESLILESQAAEQKAEHVVGKVDEDDLRSHGSSSGDEGDWEGWEDDDDGNSVSSGFLSCSGVTDIPLSSSGLWI